MVIITIVWIMVMITIVTIYDTDMDNIESNI